GLSTYWGGRLAQSLEQDDDVEAIVGIDRTPPKVALERTEFVQVADAHSLIRRIVQGAEIDTVIDTRLVVDSTVTSPRRAHENNVVGTMNILAACSGADSTVRRFVFKSSAHYYGSEQDDPAFFTEDMERPHPPRTRIERDIVEAEQLVADFAHSSENVNVCVLRFANGLGGGLRTSYTRLLRLPAVPAILGFDPRLQFIDEDDIVALLEYAARSEMEGVYNGAADGVLVLSEIADLLGKPLAPILPPWGTGAAAAALRRAGIAIPDEVLQHLRFGRGLDNRKLKAAGYRLRYTTREAALRMAEALRLEPIRRASQEPYRYERQVEDFLRYSPSVKANRRHAAKLQNVARGEGRRELPESAGG
ncbi:MAG TPA: NAD-dependent epimerase/dehydratase family protein, partial [Solirubrobacteraceae bacterium]|nr:NAD-dependent epimerase/dehydratase family protein [Solirubrobacteraceae bacterium]